VTRVVETYQTALDARGAQVVIDRCAQPIRVLLNDEAFGIALRNLLENAAKYSPTDAAAITVKIERDAGIARVHVDDQGPGVAVEERPRIFDRFYRAGNEMTRSTAGVGLGLHLVRGMIEAMHGWVTVSDALAGTGARFTLHLPIRVAPASEQPLRGELRSVRGTP